MLSPSLRIHRTRNHGRRDESEMIDDRMQVVNHGRGDDASEFDFAELSLFPD